MQLATECFALGAGGESSLNIVLMTSNGRHDYTAFSSVVDFI